MSDQDQKLFRALLEIGKELAAITELDPLLERILEISRQVFHLENAIIRLLSENGSQLITVAAFGYTQSAMDKPIALGQGVMGKAAKYKRPYLIRNLHESNDYIPGIDSARSELALPLVARDRVIGVFNVESQQVDSISAKDCDSLSILAGQAAIAIDNAHLHENLCRVSLEKQNLNHLNEKILSSISLGIYTIDEKMRITSWNDRMAKMSSISSKQALGQNLLQMFPTLEEEGIAERLRRVFSTGKAENLRLLHRGRVSQNRLQKRKLAPLEKDGKTTGVVVIVEDVTEFEQLLAQTIESEKLAEVGRMSAGVAHEINNPLSVISFCNQILLDRNNDQEQLELLERIDTEVERLQGLTSELLNYSSSQEKDQLEATDLNNTIDEVNRLLRYELNKKHIYVDKKLSELPMLLVDKNKFKQIFINIILNAVHAMADHGRLQILTALSRNNNITILFCDSGTGIPDHLKAKIFEPFFTSKKEGEGTGLGLYLCHKIINGYHGLLTVADGPNGGTCFRIILPQGIIADNETD